MHRGNTLANSNDNHCIILDEYPFPITISKAFSNKNGGGRYPTTEFREYEAKTSEYFYKHRDAILNARKELSLWISQNYMLNLQCLIVSNRWLNKDGSVKSRDVANLEKVLTDSLFRLFNLDDSLVFDLNLRKIIGPREFVIICVRPYEPEFLEEPKGVEI